MSAGAGDLVPHGTTIVAATFLVASWWPGIGGRPWATSSRSATSRRSIRPDEFSIIGIAGAAGIAVEMVGLFQVELEHYEKIEGAPLSLVGKANRLATMIRMNLPLACRVCWSSLVRRLGRAGWAGTHLLLRRHRRQI